MARLINILFTLIGYVSVATLITLLLGVGYLWHAERLDDETVFRIMAVLHDVDLNHIAAEQREVADHVPTEEPSLSEITRHQEVLDRNHEVKMLALQRGSKEYHHRFQQLKEQADRNDRLAQDLQNRLKQQQELSTQENVATVVSQLEQLKPDVAKELLLRWYDEGRMDDAILLMSKMAENKLSKILKAFEGEDELDKLHELHQRIIQGGARSLPLEKAVNNLNTNQAKS